jgi:hypothetical protein
MAEIYPRKAQEHLQDAIRHLGEAVLVLYHVDPDDTNTEIQRIQNGIIRQATELLLILTRKHEKTEL